VQSGVAFGVGLGQLHPVHPTGHENVGEDKVDGFGRLVIESAGYPTKAKLSVGSLTKRLCRGAGQANLTVSMTTPNSRKK
jgi:hypothetical protein